MEVDRAMETCRRVLPALKVAPLSSIVRLCLALALSVSDERLFVVHLIKVNKASFCIYYNFSISQTKYLNYLNY